MRRAITNARLACSRWTAEATSQQHLAVTPVWRRLCTQRCSQQVLRQQPQTPLLQPLCQRLGSDLPQMPAKPAAACGLGTKSSATVHRSGKVAQKPPSVGCSLLRAPALAGAFRLGGSVLRRSFVSCTLAPSKIVTGHGALAHALGGVRTFVKGKRRLHFKMKKHQYLKNVKRVRYVSCIPQYTGPLGRQTKKRAIIRDYRKSPRLRIFKRER
mmetsp:Transcript_17226/g.47718  ORF Transcript_17226/g.47718 Transcript_17226/m.47718 type:complete len:213 (+) Transcript_17226:102-740(+)